MRTLLFAVLTSFLYSETIVVKGPAEFQLIKVEDVPFSNESLKEWNRIQQPQIDYLLGRERSLTWMTDYLSRSFVELADYTMEIDAGQTALSNIDFGSIAEGHFSIGFGFGVSDEFHGAQAFATGLGIKYNFGDIDVFDTEIQVNGVSKGWTSGSHGGGGFGFTLDF